MPVSYTNTAVTTPAVSPYDEHSNLILILDINGGTMTVEAELGDDVWVQVAAPSADGIYSYPNVSRYRLTSATGSVFRYAYQY